MRSIHELSPIRFANTVKLSLSIKFLLKKLCPQSWKVSAKLNSLGRYFPHRVLGDLL